MDNSQLCLLYNGANKLIDQLYEGKGLFLVVCSIRHYVLDATSTNILFKTKKNQVVPFDGYDLVVSDGHFRTVFATADIRLSNLIQKNIFTVGSVISRAAVRICYSERMSRCRFFLLTDLTLNSERNLVKVDSEKLPWLPAFDPAHFNQPLLSTRLNYMSLWNITDPIGACWQSNSTIIPRITDQKAIPRGYTLTQMLSNHHGKNLTPLLVRVFAKSRLNYFARKTGKCLDMNKCPYQFDALIADDCGCCLAVFWGELAVQAFRHIEIGSVLLIRDYRIKQSFKTIEYSAICFSSLIERFKLEISVSDKLLNSRFPFDIVEPSAVSENLRLAPVPFNFIPISLLNLTPSALNNIKIDFAGVVVYAGRWYREARRYFRDASENGTNQALQAPIQDDSVTEGIVVSSASGDKYLEEFNTGGFWMWRWLILADETCQNSDEDLATVRVKYYCTSQPDLQYQLQPSDAIAITQLRILVMNKPETINSRFHPKFSLTTTNESQLFIIAKLGTGSPFLCEERVARVSEFATNLKSAFSFGGSYDYPSYPATFEALVERFQPAASTQPEQVNRELLGPVYVAAPQLETLLDGISFLEHRCLLVHGLLVFVRFVPFDDVIGQASSHLGSETGLKLAQFSSPRKRKHLENDSTRHPQLSLATAWEERQIGFRSLGLDWFHWRTLTWHWQNRSSEIILEKCVNLPSDSGGGLDNNSGSRLHLTPVSNFVGFLHAQLLLLNQSVYVNCLVPVPGNCCTDEALSRHSTTSRIIDFVNACCDNTIVSDKKQTDLAVKAIRQFFKSASSQSPSASISSSPSKVSAILNCYGLGADGVEVIVRHMYPLP